jgi:hypothetical protein
MIVCSVVVAAALTCASCGNQNNLYPVAGNVTYKGTPAAGATVFFYRRGADSMNEHMIMGLVKEDGIFELVCGSLGKGAPPGDYDVLIEWKPASGQGRGRPERGPDRLEGRYADLKNPLLHATIEAKANHLPPFDLTE